MPAYPININGQLVNIEAEAEMPLLWALRDLLGLTGTKYSCGMGICGTCTVLIESQPVRSCITPVSRVAGKSVLTIEGLSPDVSHPVWAPTQSPQSVQKAVAQVSGLPQEKVIVYTTLLGGGFGRRLQVDYAVEAAQVAKAIGAPVQVLWTRADDMQHDFYHPLSVQYAYAPLDKPALPTIQREYGQGVPTGDWRSVGEFTAAYPKECFTDELAHRLGRDPLDLRRELYRDNPRALGVINLAAEKSGWGTALPAGQGRGMAYHATFGVTHVCQVAELEVDARGNVRVKRVVCAVDCGRVVNPGNIKAQMEGGIAFGLTATLKAKITIKNGRTQQSNFMDYPILRMDEMPLVEVYIIESEEKATGIGEMGVPPIAPAVANAVFAATGARVRHIPIRPVDLKV